MVWKHQGSMPNLVLVPGTIPKLMVQTETWRMSRSDLKEDEVV